MTSSASLLLRRLRPRSFTAGLVAALALTVLLPTPARAVIIPRTITVDGIMDDWRAVDLNGDSDTDDAGEASILTNAGQFSTDAPGGSADCSTPVLSTEDQDCVVQGTGRDLEYFAFTFDDDKLYMYVRRYASLSNITNWWFYLDLDADGLMESGEKVLRVTWQGNTGATDRELYDYIPAQSGGDPLTVNGSADGYDMPGTIPSGNPPDLSPAYSGGATTGPLAGLEMETEVRWNELDPNATGPFSVGFHISSSNTDNIPGGIDDNMNGPSGGGGGGGGPLLQFSEPGLAKTGDALGVGGQPVTYTVTVTNAGPDAALGIEITDACTALTIDSRPSPLAAVLLPGESLAYFDHTASNGDGQYDPLTGVWTVPSLALNASETLTLQCLVNVDEPITVRNTATITNLSTIDTTLANNTASSGTTIVEPSADMMILKSSTATHDPVNLGSNPKRIPSGCVTYEIRVINAGRGRAGDIEITDALPAGTVLYTGDFESGATACGGSGTTAATDSPVFWFEDDSGLTLSFVSLSDAGDSFEFRDGSDAVVTPNGDFDAAVRKLVVRPTGTMLGQCCGNATGDGQHEFLIRYRVRIE